jgi:hypothetical protein
LHQLQLLPGVPAAQLQQRLLAASLVLAAGVVDMQHPILPTPACSSASKPSLNNEHTCTLLQVLYATACCGPKPQGDGSFVPLSVHYQERFSAAGKTR